MREKLRDLSPRVLISPTDDDEILQKNPRRIENKATIVVESILRQNMHVVLFNCQIERKRLVSFVVVF